jgi:outer membrane protein
MRRFLPLLAFLLVHLAQAQTPWTLEQCIARAEEKHLDVLNATLDADLADHNLERTYWDLAPDLNAGGTHGYNFGRVVDRYTNTFATDRVRTNNFYLSTQVDLFRGLSKQNSIKQAGIDADAAVKSLEAARNDVRMLVVQAFLDILGIKERIVAAEKQAANTREQITLTTALVEGGRLARAELLALEAQLAQEEYNVTDWSNQKDQRTLALGRALQLEPAEIRHLEIIAPELSASAILEPTSSMDQVLTNVLANNPSYGQMELVVKSAEQDIAISRAGHLPTLSASGSIGTGYSGRDFEQVGDPIVGDPVPIGATSGGDVVFAPNIDYATEVIPFSEQLDQNFNQSVGLTLNVPIFNNMRNSYAVQQSRVQYEKSRNRLTALRNDLQQNVLDALVQQRSAHRQYLAAAKALESGELSLEYAQERFAQGVITSLELNTAKTNVNRSQADLINAKYQYLMASKYLDILQGLPVTL